jgi:hypothetical protein
VKPVAGLLLGTALAFGGGAQAASPVNYVDAKNHYALTVPANWRYESRGGITPKNVNRPGTCVDLFDSHEQRQIAVCGRPKKTAAGMIENELRAGVEQYLEASPGVVLQAASLHELRLGGNAAVAAVFENANGTETWSVTWIQSESMRLNFFFFPAESGANTVPEEVTQVLNSVRIP